jgi:coproporphyrinogen III oxidase-like Fe-S oxidoreductase
VFERTDLPDDVAGPVGLYVHVPFCEAKCAYCDFASWADAGSLEGRWIAAMEAELGRRRQELDGRPLDTVFVGGGTPSALSAPVLGRLCDALARLPLAEDAEWSCEANPGSLSEEKLSLLLEHGVNRLSLGVQSFDDSVLKRMGRVHDAEGAREACRLLGGLRELVGLGARHVSFYGLTIEPGTGFGKALREGRLREVDEDEYVRMYLEGSQYLEAEGLRRYEVSNFACPGEECRHNQGYWRRDGAWLAAGNAAHGYVPGRRWSSPRELRPWLEWVEAGCPGSGLRTEELGLEERYTEAWFLGLRTARGVDLAALRHEFGQRADLARMRRWVESGFLRREAEQVCLSDDGWLMLDAIAADCSL